MKAEIPLPSFEDIRKILQFWIDQQDKWFYFETDVIHSSSHGDHEESAPLYAKTTTHLLSNQTNLYVQSRIIGQIHDVISYPPSLMLSDAAIFTVRINYDQNSFKLISNKKRRRFGLVFSQITYFEPIDDLKSFLKIDDRVNS